MSKYRLKFGKYKNKTLDNIPFDYLRWLVKKGIAPKPVKEYVNQHKDFI